MARAQGNDIVDIAGEITAETEKAVRFYDGSRTVWLPRSQIEIYHAYPVVAHRHQI